jgi:hypothetical protein
VDKPATGTGVAADLRCFSLPRIDLSHGKAQAKCAFAWLDEIFNLHEESERRGGAIFLR